MYMSQRVKQRDFISLIESKNPLEENTKQLLLLNSAVIYM